MNKEEFINWITDLGFTKTWNNSEGNEYSILIGNDNNGIFHEKLYFIIEKFDIRLYYSNFKNGMSFGSNLGYFPIKDIGEFEKTMILSVLLKHCKDKIPPKFKKYLRDSKIKNILED